MAITINPLAGKLILGGHNLNIDTSSIPSPYARMHHIDAAFKFVYDSVHGNLPQNGGMFTGCGIDEHDRNISDCLDLFQLFYNYDSLNLAQKNITVASYCIDHAAFSTLHAPNDDQKLCLTFSQILKAYGDGYKRNPHLANQHFDKGYFIARDNTIFAATSPFTGYYTCPHQGIGFTEGGKEYFSDAQIQWQGIAVRPTDFVKFLYHLLTKTDLQQCYVNLKNYICAYATYIGEAHTWGAEIFDGAMYGFTHGNVPQFSPISPNTAIPPAVRPLVIPNKYHQSYFRYLFLPSPDVKFELSPADYTANPRQFMGRNRDWLSTEDFFREYIIEIAPTDQQAGGRYLEVANEDGVIIDEKILFPIKQRYSDYFTDAHLRGYSKVIKLNNGGYVVKLGILIVGGIIWLEKAYQADSVEFPIGRLIPAHESKTYLSIYPFLQDISHSKETGLTDFRNSRIKPGIPQPNNTVLPAIVPHTFNQPLFQELTNSVLLGLRLLILKNEQTDDYNPTMTLRELIGQKLQWLSTDDFLYDNMIELSDPIQDERFYTATVYCEKTSEYIETRVLLPLKELYYQYFDVSTITDAVKVVKLRDNQGYRVTVDVPVSGGTVQLGKTYNSGASAYPDGKLVSLGAHSIFMGIFPFVKDINPATCAVSNSYYRVLLYHGMKAGFDCSLSFLRRDGHQLSAINANHVKSRTFHQNRGNSFPVATYYALDRLNFNNVRTAIASDQRVDFDFVKVTVVNDGITSEAVVAPHFVPVHCTDITGGIGVDFGTSNTHICFQSGGVNPTEFTSLFDHNQLPYRLLTMLHKPTRDTNDSGQMKYDFSLSTGFLNQLHYENEFMPIEIVEGGTFKFSIPTILNEHENGHNLNSGSIALLDTNIAIAYYANGSRQLGGQHIDKHNLGFKWLNTAEDEHRIRLFLEQLMLMARAHLMAKGYSLSAVKLIWTTPLSMNDRMAIGVHNTLATVYTEIWQYLYAKYFFLGAPGAIPAGNLKSVSESRSPLYFSGNVAAVHGTVLTVDIGGGSSDVLLYQNAQAANNITLTTSFEFAANHLFAGNRINNIFFKKYPREVEGNNTAVMHPENDPAVSVPDLFNYRFSKAPDAINGLFNRANRQWMLLLTLHNSTLIYHLAQTCKMEVAENYPSGLSFSGNGSKLFNLLDKAGGVGSLGRLINAIFKNVYATDNPALGQPIFLYSHDVTVKGATSYGAVHMLTVNGGNDIDGRDLQRYHILKGDAETHILYTDHIRRNAELAIPEDRKLFVENVVHNVESFLKAFFAAGSNSLFGQSIDTFCHDGLIGGHYDMRLLNAVWGDNLSQKIEQAILNSMVGRNQVSSTLFFEPIKQLIVDLSAYFVANPNR